MASVVLQAIGIPEPRPVGADPEEVFIVVIVVLHFAAMAFLYLNSAARLKRLGIPAEDEVPPDDQAEALGV